MRPRFIAVLTVLALCRMILPLQAQQRGPIIDMHLHAGPDDSLRPRVVALMDEFNIVEAFLSDPPPDDCRPGQRAGAWGRCGVPATPNSDERWRSSKLREVV